MCTLYYMIIKDSMVVIHLAKISILEKCCDYFKQVFIPSKVYQEIIICKNKNSEVNIIEDLINNKKINVKEVEEKRFLEKAYSFNIQRGEAEVVALYWQENARYLASDDNNLRKKKILLNLNLIGTPAIILKLYEQQRINKEEFIQSLNTLKKIGWFNNMLGTLGQNFQVGMRDIIKTKYSTDSIEYRYCC